MSSKLVLGSTGKPHAQCPVCGRVHPVMRRGDYLKKPVLRFRCRNPECHATWRASEEERKQILDYFQVKEQPKKEVEKHVETEKNVDRSTKRKKSFWDNLA